MKEKRKMVPLRVHVDFLAPGRGLQSRQSYAVDETLKSYEMSLRGSENILHLPHGSFFTPSLYFILKCPSGTLLCSSPFGLSHPPPAHNGVTVAIRWNCGAVSVMKQWWHCWLSWSWAGGRGSDSMMLAAASRDAGNSGIPHPGYLSGGSC